MTLKYFDMFQSYILLSKLKKYSTKTVKYHVNNKNGILSLTVLLNNVSSAVYNLF